MAINKKDYSLFGPFKLWTIENFPFIEADFDAITNYQLYSKIVEQMRKLCENQTKLQQSQNEVIDAFNNLVKYVDDYFTNLDVQEEIDNKLDEMAESGQLSDIIAQYLELAGVLAFNTITDLSDAENITNGSICNVLGQNTYNDGKGGFYKIRTITSGDVVDGFNIVELDVSNTLIAERIPNYYINDINENIDNLENDINNKYNRTDNLFLQNYILYDIPSTQYSQGSTNDPEQNIYIYKTQNNVSGDILVFKNEQLINTISNVNLYHGNSLCYLNNRIYATKTSDTKIIEYYDLTSATISEIDPFSDLTEYTEVIGLAKYSNNEILCLLGYKDGTTYVSEINKCLVAILNVNDNSYRTISLTNTNLYNVSNLAIQGCAYYNNHIYLLCSQPNIVLDFIISEDEANLNKIYNIPAKDLFGLGIGEVEQLSLYESAPGTFLLTTHILENSGIAQRTIKTYFLSFETELASLYHRIIVDDIDAYRLPVYCNSNSTNLYENGSQTYPFKSITRALLFVNYNKLYDTEQILIMPGNYNIGTLYNLHKGNINEGSNSGQVNFVNTSRFVNCNLDFSSVSSTLYFNKIEIDSGVINMKGHTHCDNIIDVIYGKLYLNGLISTYNVNDSIPIRVREGSFSIIDVISKVTATNMFYITNGSVLISNDNTKTTAGNYTFISTGSHNAD